MDKWRTTLRVEEIRRQIAEIQAADRVYKGHVTHTMAEIAQHENRQVRLRQIIAELKVLSGQSAG